MLQKYIGNTNHIAVIKLVMIVLESPWILELLHVIICFVKIRVTEAVLVRAVR